MSPENSRPISPKEALIMKEKLIPDEAIDSFNEMIAGNYSRGKAGFSQDAVIALMERKGLKREDVIRNGWLSVIEIYEKAGWEVRCSGGGMDTDSDPYYTFKEYSPIEWD